MKDYNYPNSNGMFDKFGGAYVSETLIPLLDEVKQAYAAAKEDPSFARDLAYYAKHYTGRPSPLYYAQRLTRYLGGAKIYFKRDELNHTGAHKINHCIGQILLAERMGKTRIIAETGAGQHGVATATVATLFEKKSVIYMGERDIERQKPNVFRMKLLGADVQAVKAGSATLKDAMNEAMRDWVANVDDTYYMIGTAAGPHPYPEMVRDFQSVIGLEVMAQMQEAEGRAPDALIACIGGGSNALGLFTPYIPDTNVRLIAVEAAGKGLESGQHAASIARGSFGVMHGNASYYLQNDDGQISPTYSVSAGLDYPGIGPEHALLHEAGRVEYISATDEDAVEAFRLCARTEGILPALEPSHALARAMNIAAEMRPDQIIVVNICGRGDKDIFTVADYLNEDMK